MEIESFIEHRGNYYKVYYQDGVPETLSNPKITGVHTYCFYKDKLVIVGHEGKNWTPPGGAVENGETYEEAAKREIAEETNMKVLHMECMGYQDAEDLKNGKFFRQCRMFAIVEPQGEFTKDPDGDISEIKLINPYDYREYISWGEVGDWLIKRALELKDKYNNS